MTTALSPNVDRLKQKLVTVKSRLVEAFKTAGFETEVVDSDATSKWPSSTIFVTSTKIEQRDFKQLIRVYFTTHRMGLEPEGLGVEFVRQSYRGRVRRYTKIDDNLYDKIVGVVQEMETDTIRRVESSSKAKTEEAQWQAVRAKELAGIVLPPGLDCNIIMGSGGNAGKYSVRLDRYSYGLTQTPLTRDQVIRLIQVVNEILNVENARVICAAVPGNGLLQDRVQFWCNGNEWRVTTHTSAKLVFQDTFDAEWKAAYAKAGNGWKVEALRYVDVATIGKNA
jgi:hypothetical protein